VHKERSFFMAGIQVKHEVTKGRGATLQIEGRFEKVAREIVDDGWGWADEALPPFKTTVTIEHAKRIIARNDSPDLPFSQSINAYRGCEHGCIYCYARPAHAYVNLSPGLDFERKLFANCTRIKHGSLSTDRARVADHAANPGSAGGTQASGFHRHQVCAG
jgi:hypothetical protein